MSKNIQASETSSDFSAFFKKFLYNQNQLNQYFAGMAQQQHTINNHLQTLIEALETTRTRRAPTYLIAKGSWKLNQNFERQESYSEEQGPVPMKLDKMERKCYRAKKPINVRKGHIMLTKNKKKNLKEKDYALSVVKKSIWQEIVRTIIEQTMK
ncbi:473_t:CDS:2 [Gigaspora margarita]|uniref:473_t:CDS:1 n=1 Tax=Gigaspora margarita TaxID=4874 RepID=A0ABN7URQ3_GIGMA|nr:473_t:CDS:2 [Gigaspora margarita]